MANLGSRMIQTSWLLACCCGLLVASCELISKKNAQQTVGKKLDGSWVCSNVLDKVARTKSIKQLKDLPPYTELIFLQDSSKLVALNGQIDMATLPYKYSGEVLQIYDSYGNTEAYISIVSDSVLLFNDGFSAEAWRYIKAPAGAIPTDSANVPEVFPSLLNSTLVSGEYTVKNVDKPYRVTLGSNGKIFNSPDFTSYSLCYNGSCNILSDEDLIYLSNGQQGDFYGWKIQGNTLTIYSLLTVNMPDEMMMYELGNPILVLEKI